MSLNSAQVWTILYGLMGYASHMTVRAQADQALQLYYAQLALNMLWTPLFFGGQHLFLSLEKALMVGVHSEAEGDRAGQHLGADRNRCCHDGAQLI